MDIDKLIERLNNRASRPRLKVPGEAFTSTGVYTKDILDKEAATAISTLQIENQALRNSANGFKAENEKLRAELEKELAARKKQADILYELKSQKYEQTQIIDKLRAELEQVKAERDAAIADIYNMGGCPNCKHNIGRSDNTQLPICSKKLEYPTGKCFEWRGPQKEN